MPTNRETAETETAMVDQQTEGGDEGAADLAMQRLTFRYRLLPTKGQHARLRGALDHTRDLYNAALEERINAYAKFKKSINWAQQSQGLTELRSDPEWSVFAVTMQRWPLKQVDLAFKAFFSRLKVSSGKAGYPRFRGREWFKTFGFVDRDGWRVRSGRLWMKGIGAIRLNIHRSLPENIVSCKVKRSGKNWIALITGEVPCATRNSDLSVGIDLGVAQLATLSTGETVPNQRHAARMSACVRRAQRMIARCRQGSKNRTKAKARLSRLKLCEANSRRTYLHQVSAYITHRYSTIILEKLNIKGMVRSASGTNEVPGVKVAQKSGLNRAIHDAAFGTLKELLSYKAVKAGGKVIEVDARYTSQTCSVCGVLDIASRVSQSRFVCTGCGQEMNADYNAARNIAMRGGVLVPSSLNFGVV